MQEKQPIYSVDYLDSIIVTPMMRQYIDIKKQYPDYLLFFRMGDFYELFYDDAVKASKILDIALTKRGKDKENATPMCGVPHHAHEAYLAKLIKNNQKIVICDQVETVEEAKRRGHKAIVKRDVIRIVTSGTITEENLLTSNKANFLMSIYGDNLQYSIAYTDISTGEFYYNSIPKNQLLDEVNKIDPSEILICDNIFSDKALLSLVKTKQEILSNFPESFFHKERTVKSFENFFNLAYQDKLNINENTIKTIGSLVEYIKITQKENCPKLNFPKNANKSGFMELDNTTLQHLEVFNNNANQAKKTLYNVINFTKTAAGSRKLREIICAPLTNKDRIIARQNLAEFFIKDEIILTKIQNLLRNIADIQRLLAKITTSRASLRDYIALKQSLITISEIALILMPSKNLELEPNLKIFKTIAHDFNHLIMELNKIVQNEVNDKNFVNFIANNISSDLDELKDLQNNAKESINNLQKKYQEQTNIPGLRIKSTNVWGYFIEINSKDYDKIDQSIFIQRQSLANATRFITTELTEFQNKIFSSDQKISEIELAILVGIRDSVLAEFDQLQNISEKISYLDIICSNASAAITYDFCKPEISEGDDLIIEAGFHPVVRKYLPDDIHEYVANDCHFDKKTKIKLLTGPNMAGKSTYLRQNAIITLLAQIGSFIPAKSAKIGLVDRIFSRIGSSDDITHGRSTFMVEMIETATILNQATDKSFIILDEIGRGTSTYDGLSIAMAITEYLHDKIQARVIFATHYHELTELEQKLTYLSCYQVIVSESNQNIIFKHQVIKGKATKSYGIMVAKLAGIPNEVIKYANMILTKLESPDNKAKPISDLPLFQMPMPETNNDNTAVQNINAKLIAKLSDINPDQISPKQALEFIYDLKNEIDQSNK
jgi:DNA mismatch repair protein MutS